MNDLLTFHLNRLKEKLWVRPLATSIFSVAGAMLAKAFDYVFTPEHLPEISPDSLEVLLTTLSASMLVIATFAVGSMVAAYASAGSNATPRTFSLVIADDVSQNALSTFIGAFIFSVIAIVFVKDDFYGIAGRLALFVLTGLVFAIVIMTFVRWVDRIARLGRLGSVIDKVERVTRTALKNRRRAPTFGCVAAEEEAPDHGRELRSRRYGYVQRIDVRALQSHAEALDADIRVLVLPGTFISPERALARIAPGSQTISEEKIAEIERAFVIGDDRTFDDDPRFGLIVLSEIAGRALSPAVNDPGTAIDIIGTLVRLFAEWAEPIGEKDLRPCNQTRVHVAALSTRDMFDDAFTAIARDGAGSVEVATRLQKALRALASLDNADIQQAAIDHSQLALARAEQAMTLPHDLEAVREVAAFSSRD